MGGRAVERRGIVIKLESFELGVIYKGDYPGIRRIAVYVVVLRANEYEVLVSRPHKDEWLSVYHSKCVGAIVTFMNSVSGETLEKVAPYVCSS